MTSACWILKACTRRNWCHGRSFLIEQRNGFRRAPPKKPEQIETELKKSHDTPSQSSFTPPIAEPIHPARIHIAKQLYKPFLFTVGFSGCSFGIAAIWQYESLKSRMSNYFEDIRADWLEKMRPPKHGNFRKQVNEWWNSLSEGQRTVSGIIAANVLVFCLWRVPSMQRTMIRYFTSNPASSVIASFASYVSKVATGRFGPSLGASGAIMTVLAAVCTKMPEARLAIIFLPMFTFTAGNALKAILALDAVGLCLGWKYFDHAAHLGGALFGIWYALYGHELIWKKREPFVKIWHEFRNKPPRNGGT
ncbi:presenilin-associated rhomboid-like protein, mitochondrial isoform X2 [Lithobates pipiens]